MARGVGGGGSVACVNLSSLEGISVSTSYKFQDVMSGKPGDPQ